MKYISLFIVSVFVILSACDTTISTESGRVLPNVTGGSGAVLVVIDNFVWESMTGESLQDILKEEFPALPQSEPLFDVAHITSASFDNSLRFHRSVVIVTINNQEKSLQFVSVRMCGPSHKLLCRWRLAVTKN